MPRVINVPPKAELKVKLKVVRHKMDLTQKRLNRARRKATGWVYSGKECDKCGHNSTTRTWGVVNKKADEKYEKECKIYEAYSLQYWTLLDYIGLCDEDELAKCPTMDDINGVEAK